MNNRPRCEARCRRKPVAYRVAGTSRKYLKIRQGVAAVLRPIGMCIEGSNEARHTAGNRSRAWHVRPGPQLENLDVRLAKTTSRSPRGPVPAIPQRRGKPTIALVRPAVAAVVNRRPAG